MNLKVDIDVFTYSHHRYNVGSVTWVSQSLCAAMNTNKSGILVSRGHFIQSGERTPQRAGPLYVFKDREAARLFILLLLVCCLFLSLLTGNVGTADATNSMQHCKE